MSDGKFDPEAYFGGIDPDDIEEGFIWFEIARKDEQMIKRKSSVGATII